MTNNISALTIGSAEIYINGEKCGFVTDVEIEKRIELLRHETNVGLEFATDHIVPLRRSYFVRGKFGEIDPPTINNALGLAGLTSPAVQTTENMTEYPRLYKDRWFTLRHQATASITLTSTDGLTTYISGTDYEVNSDSTAIRLIEGGTITPGTLLKLTYDYTGEASSQVALSAPGVIKPVHIVLVHRYPDGESVLEVTLPKVVLDTDIVLALDEKDWIGIAFEGECLPDENNPDAPFGFQRFFGPIFSVQSDSAADVPDNPYVPEHLTQSQV
ncbi:hypothetical protein J7K50_05245 [bacterium]|nr:hypothetical protein [bacterium]